MAMGCTIRWDDPEQTILLCEIDDPWTWEEFTSTVKQQIAMMETVDHRVHTIFHIKSPRLNIHGGAISHLKRLMEMTHPNEDQHLIVGAPGLIRSLISTLHKVYGLRQLVESYRFVATLDEAYEFLKQYEQSRHKG
jgi:hypothetical protein